MLKKPVVSDVRHPYYEIGDHIFVLADAVREDPLLSKDQRLLKLLVELRQKHVEIAKALADYNWD